MKRKWKIALTAVCAVALVTVAYAATAGGEGDPLVTLSYLKNIFTGEVQTMVDDSVAAGEEQVKGDLDAAIKDWDVKVSQAVEDAVSSESGQTGVFTPVTLTKGQTLTCGAGSEFILRTGSVTGSIALTDSTAGSALAKGQALTVSHLYLTDADCTFTVTGSVLTGTVKSGPLNLRSGAGSSYSVLGTLPAGTVVTILDTSVSGWYQVTAGSLTGYVAASYITQNAPTGSDTATLMVRGSYTVK